MVKDAFERNSTRKRVGMYRLGYMLANMNLKTVYESDLSTCKSVLHDCAVAQDHEEV